MVLRTLLLSVTLASIGFPATAREPGANPAITDCFTADPAPVAIGDTVYLITDHDEAKGSELYTMRDWLCYTSKDMKDWEAHPPIMKVTDFSWATQDAWAPQMVPHDGRYYFYAPVNTRNGMAIGVAVADTPLGPYKDALGHPLVTPEMTKGPYYSPNIDPTIFIDDDGTPWLAWGNNICFLAKLKPHMVELDGAISTICVPNYTEGPWLWKHNGLYYLCYASFAHQDFGESISYATAPKVTGPWTYRGEITGNAKNSFTIHPGIVDDFHGQSYFFYHNATLTLKDGQTGATGRRCVCIEYLYYNPDGTIQPITQTEEGVSVPPHPASSSASAIPDRGPSAPGVKVTQFISDFPRSWPGTPAFATVDDPFEKTQQGLGFHNEGGATSLGQTFVPKQDIHLSRISLYAGDGIGTSPANTVTLALYDLGLEAATNPAADSYTVGTELLGSGKGLQLAYSPQGPGLVNIDLAASTAVDLKSGHRYALELQGVKNSFPIYWYSSQYVYGTRDVYADGNAYRDRKLMKSKDGVTSDFGFALYDAQN